MENTLKLHDDLVNTEKEHQQKVFSARDRIKLAANKGIVIKSYFILNYITSTWRYPIPGYLILM